MKKLLLLFAFLALPVWAADTPISGLSSTSGLADGDLFPHVDISDTAQSSNGTTKKATASQIKSYVFGAAVSVANGGTGGAPASDDQVLVSDTTSAATGRTLPNCTDTGGNHLNYTTATNSFSCGTTSSGGAGAAVQTHIAGLLVTKNAGGNTLDITAGEAYVPAGSAVASYAGATAVSAGTLGASQWNQVYLNSDASITVTNNADPPSSAYMGTARKDGSDRRWIASFKTDASSNIISQTVTETGQGRFQIIYTVATTAAPFRVLDAGSATSYGAETSLVGVVPRYAAVNWFGYGLLDFVTTAAAVGTMHLSMDGTNSTFISSVYVPTTGTFPAFSINLPLRTSTPGIYYKLVAISPGVGTRGYLDVTGYGAAR
jgi:hypothetical protein